MRCGAGGRNPQGQIPIPSLTLVIAPHINAKGPGAVPANTAHVLRGTSGTNWAQELSLTLKI